MFIHTNGIYQNRCWVLVDGDQVGIENIEKIKESFPSWNQKHFKNLNKHNFELYLPDRFSNKVKVIEGMSRGKDKKQLKSELLAEVKAWIASEPETAKREFEISAKEILLTLSEIKNALNV
jgi:hypothetical protein